MATSLEGSIVGRPSRRTPRVADRVARRTVTIGLALSGLCLGRAAIGPGTAAEPASPPALRDLIADLKPSFPEHPGYSAVTALTEGNLQAVLDGLQGLGVNGLRLPIVPAYAGPGQYPALHGQVHASARRRGLTIYASPLSVGMRDYEGWSDERYAGWLAAYASAFAPEILSPFNEAAIDGRRMARIVERLRSSSPVTLAGPDRQHVGRTLQDLAAHPEVAALFDIVTSHNADRDAGATSANWAALVGLAGPAKPVWSSENPSGWSRGRDAALPGIDQAVEGGVRGVVVWMAKPSLVDDEGRPTAKGREIARHVAVAR